ncbi:hypothetical protein ACFE04_011782 [Oxalis oulophora]
MPKKMGVNSKAEEARARKNALESEKKDRDNRQKEETYWREAGDGAKSRAAKKRDDEAEKRAEAAARKAEARRLAELEEKEIDKSLNKKSDKKANRLPFPVPKVTEAELRRRKEEEAKKLAEEGNKRSTRTAAEEEYERMVLIANTNRDDSIIEARTVDQAIAQISLSDNALLPDKHPERRLKAAFKYGIPASSKQQAWIKTHVLYFETCFWTLAIQFIQKLTPLGSLAVTQAVHHNSCNASAFEEAELPRLKEEKPGLTHTQYKDMIWKLWKKSPDNPLNQQASFVKILWRSMRSRCFYTFRGALCAKDCKLFMESLLISESCLNNNPSLS